MGELEKYVYAIYSDTTNRDIQQTQVLSSENISICEYKFEIFFLYLLE